MRSLLVPSVRLAALTTLAAFVAAQRAAPPPAAEPTFELSRAERADGWHVLFDGTSTDAWRGYRADGFPEQGWVVRDGALVHVAGGGGGDLITRRRYRNFELELAWRVAPRANSGIMYRVVETDGPSYLSGPEYQVLDGGGGRDPSTGAGALYGLYAAQGADLRPAGAWNSTRIVVDGDRVEHWLNGARVVDARIGSADWQARVADSKFRDWEDFAAHPRGHVCLQDHGDEVAYRNVRIRELPPSPERLGDKVVLFDGESLNGWRAHLRGAASRDDVWSVAGGILHCAGQPAGYLYTEGVHDSFVLEVEWSFTPEAAGNSGVLLRRTGEHRVWPRSIEAQLQSARAGDIWNIGEFPMQVVTARTRGRQTRHTHGNEQPLGEWNRYRIVADGPWLRLSVNGEVVNEAWDCEVVAGEICLQSEGVPIRFRRIELWPLRDAR